MKRLLISCVVLAVCFVAVSNLQAERPIPAEKALQMASNPEPAPSAEAVRQLDTPIQTPAPKGARAIGTITYDDGTVTAVPVNSSFCYGNQFNTWSGNAVMASGSVTALDIYMAGMGGTAAFVSILGPVGAGTSAAVLTSFSTPLAIGWNAVVPASPVNYVGSSFLAGVWYFGGDSVGLGSGTVAGQGGHGMYINDISGTGFVALSSVNALVRASGDVLPVELMTFTVQ